MREIKFRIWLKKDKAMSPPASLTDLIISGIKYPQSSLHFVKSIQQEKSIVMQYTGLHDKNGKEIYEGDIIGYLTPLGKISQTTIKPVMWVTRNKYSGWCFGHSNQWLVLGNIYENKDLLK